MTKRLIVLFFTCISLLHSNATYEIKEQDLLSEIESKKDIFEEKFNQHKKEVEDKVENYTGEILTKATISQLKFIDPTYTVDKDIPKYNKMGEVTGVLYKKGYKFNPIEFMNVLPPDFIVFNVCDANESSYVKTLIKQYEDKNKDYMLVNSGCKNKDVKNSSFNSKVYFLTKEMITKFNLEHTVSIITVSKEIKQIVIKEVAINENTNF